MDTAVKTPGQVRISGPLSPIGLSPTPHASLQHGTGSSMELAGATGHAEAPGSRGQAGGPCNFNSLTGEKFRPHALQQPIQRPSPPPLAFPPAPNRRQRPIPRRKFEAARGAHLAAKKLPRRKTAQNTRNLSAKPGRRSLRFRPPAAQSQRPPLSPQAARKPSLSPHGPGFRPRTPGRPICPADPGGSRY